MATNVLTSNIPRLLTPNVPPVYSSGRSVPFCARSARSLLASASDFSVICSQPMMAGISSPSSTAMAIPIFTLSFGRITSPSRKALNLGCFLSAAAHALMMRSLTVTRTPSPSSDLFICWRRLIASVISTSDVT